MPEHHHCYDCEEEFSVSSVYETESDVSFCPFCGSELDLEEEEDDLDDLEDEDYRD